MPPTSSICRHSPCLAFRRGKRSAIRKSWMLRAYRVGNSADSRHLPSFGTHAPRPRLDREATAAGDRPSMPYRADRRKGPRDPMRVPLALLVALSISVNHGSDAETAPAHGPQLVGAPDAPLMSP